MKKTLHLRHLVRAMVILLALSCDIEEIYAQIAPPTSMVLRTTIWPQKVGAYRMVNLVREYSTFPLPAVKKVTIVSFLFQEQPHHNI